MGKDKRSKRYAEMDGKSMKKLKNIFSNSKLDAEENLGVLLKGGHDKMGKNKRNKKWEEIMMEYNTLRSELESSELVKKFTDSKFEFDAEERLSKLLKGGHDKMGKNKKDKKYADNGKCDKGLKVIIDIIKGYIIKEKELLEEITRLKTELLKSKFISAKLSNKVKRYELIIADLTDERENLAKENNDIRDEINELIAENIIAENKSENNENCDSSENDKIKVQGNEKESGKFRKFQKTPQPQFVKPEQNYRCQDKKPVSISIGEIKPVNSIEVANAIEKDTYIAKRCDLTEKKSIIMERKNALIIMKNEAVENAGAYHDTDGTYSLDFICMELARADRELSKIDEELSKIDEELDGFNSKGSTTEFITDNAMQDTQKFPFLPYKVKDNKDLKQDKSTSQSLRNNMKMLGEKYNKKVDLNYVKSYPDGVLVLFDEHWNKLIKLYPDGAYVVYYQAEADKEERALISSYYNKEKNLVLEKYSTGDWTKYFYDEKGNKIKELYSSGKSKLYFYDDNRNLVKELFPSGKWKKYSYDDNGNMILLEHSNRRWTKYFYDENNNRVREEKSSGSWTEYTYDEKGNLVLEKYSDKSRREYTYNENNIKIKEKRFNPDDLWVEYFYNEQGDLINKRNSYGLLVEYTYDEHGNRIGEVCGF